MKRREPTPFINYKKSGDRPNDYLGAAYLPEEMRLTGQIEFCGVCCVEHPSFRVPAFGGRLKHVHFCSNCGEPVSKKARLLGQALRLPAEVVYHDGQTELHAISDFCDRPPMRVLHCGEPMSIVYLEQKTADVILHTYECSQCQQEKLLKFFRGRET